MSARRDPRRARHPAEITEGSCRTAGAFSRARASFSPSFSGKPEKKDGREAIPHRLVQKRMGLRSKVRTAEVCSSAAFFCGKNLEAQKKLCYDTNKTPPAANAAADRREGPVAAMRYRGNENYDALPEALRNRPALLALDGHDAALCRKSAGAAPAGAAGAGGMAGRALQPPERESFSRTRRIRRRR